jgi:hypothetical protein
MGSVINVEYNETLPDAVDGTPGPAQGDEHYRPLVIATVANFRGDAVAALSAVAVTTTSAAIDVRGFNSAQLLITIADAVKLWTVKLTGCATSGGTYVDLYEGATQMSKQTSASIGITWKGLPNYVKVVATEDENGATCSVSLTPMNVI